MFNEIDTQESQTVQIDILRVIWSGFDYHLELVVML